MAPSFKALYLIHGDDHGRIGERRAALRDLAEAQSGAQGVELLEGEQATPDNVAATLNAMTFAIGRRFIIVDGVERWKDADLDALEQAIAAIAPDTTVAFFAREEGRLKAPERLIKVLTRAGGAVSVEAALKPWELPKWVVAEGRSLGLALDPDAARTLVAQVGERQQRLLRELEKLALCLDATEPGGAGPIPVDAALISELTAGSAQRRAWSLADALVSGDGPRAAGTLIQLRAQGERLAGLTYWMGTRLRQAHSVAAALEQGRSAAQIKKTLRMPPRAADQLIADAGRAGSEHLRAAIATVADLELASRGAGGRGVGEDTLTLLAIREMAG